MLPRKLFDSFRIAKFSLDLKKFSFYSTYESHLLNIRDSNVQVSYRKVLISLTILHSQGPFIVASIGAQLSPSFHSLESSNEINQSRGEAHFSSPLSFRSKLSVTTVAVSNTILRISSFDWKLTKKRKGA